MKRLLRFRSLMRLPHLVRLSLRLVQDARIPAAHKAMAVGAIVRVLPPLDLSGWMPLIGQGRDAVVIVAILGRFIGAAPAQVVRASGRCASRRPCRVRCSRWWRVAGRVCPAPSSVRRP